MPCRHKNVALLLLAGLTSTLSSAPFALSSASAASDGPILKIAGGKEIESLDPILVDGADAGLVARRPRHLRPQDARSPASRARGLSPRTA